MIRAFVICAGKQSRFDSETPKALMPYENTTILDHNLEILNKYCDFITIVTSYDNMRYFINAGITHKCVLVEIESGHGCGDAVYEAIRNQMSDGYDLIMWGDTIITEEYIVKKLVKCNNDALNIPVQYEDNPYVRIDFDNHKVEFSKYGEVTGSGYHDLSMFICKHDILLDALKSFKFQILDTNNPGLNYVCRHGNEMTFLDVINYTMIKLNKVELNNYKDLSFNTLEEYNELTK